MHGAKLFGNRFKGKGLSGWSPTPLPVVTEALRLAELRPSDLLFDLGCGDGRVIVRAAKLYGARAIGVDIDPERLRNTNLRIANAGVKRLVRVRCQDLLSIPDLRRASVVFVYLPPGAIKKLRPLLRRRCRRGTRVISVLYELRASVTGGWFRNWRTKKELWLRIRRQKWYIGLWVVD
jgi:SAM-dependent methyltransferase